jgi:hypothetical protein
MLKIKNIPPDDLSSGAERFVAEVPLDERANVEFQRITQVMMDVSHTSNPVADKVTEAHIGIVLKNADKRDARDRRERAAVRMQQLIILIVGLAFLVFLIFFLKDKPEILIPIISATLAFIAGFTGGYGYKSSEKSS